MKPGVNRSIVAGDQRPPIHDTFLTGFTVTLDQYNKIVYDLNHNPEQPEFDQEIILNFKITQLRESLNRFDRFEDIHREHEYRNK